ncbi:Rieske 2Fe-2S domain-containing protein [Streptomyces alkaliphilus]|uniref:Cytochrome bc1 complex Rieske iron-sulfur subunit n=2 Tax=Streptomyces alkaliphilus TaxID=1472722 RepID=A0A7W3Y3J5_9ACTN|nr:Rieske 2Fe-2S domain-containing protein [Streptomyces alkaliphilus]
MVTHMTGPMTSRRTAVAAGAAGLAAVLTGCGGSEDGGVQGGTDSPGPGRDATGGAGDDDGDATGGAEGQDGGTGGGELTRVSDVPEGGGVILGDERVVVTQPEPGEYRAFSAVCTHQGCVVSDISNGAINCACHQSSFSITDGSVLGGPATAPLPEQAITVEGDSVRLG